MDRYKINYVFHKESDINEIFIKVLNYELEKYIEVICKNKKCEILSSCMQFSQEGRKNC